MNIYRKSALAIALAIPFVAQAQIGQHRNEFSLGINGGYVMSNIGFTPKVTQNYHGGMTADFHCAMSVKNISALYALYMQR